MYDVFFQCFDEPNADENFKVLKQKAPHAQRVDNIVGIHNAHKFCAQQSKTELFYLIDGDSYIKEDFEFKYTGFEENKVYFWEALDNIYNWTGLHGCLKLFSRELVLNSSEHMGMDSTMTIKGDFKVRWGQCINHIAENKWIPDILDKPGDTAIRNNGIHMTSVASIHKYNSSPFNTWKSIFREYIKMSSIRDNEINISRKTVNQLNIRLLAYRSHGKENSPGYAWYAKLGANAAHSYYENHKNSLENLVIVNDYDKLSEMFNEFNYLGS